MSKKDVEQMIKDSLEGCKIRKVDVVRVTLKAKEEKAIVQVVVVPDGSFAITGEVEVPYMPVPASTQARDQILFRCKIDYATNEGVEYFGRVPWRDLHQLVTDGFRVEADGPLSVEDLIERMKTDDTLLADGYATRSEVVVEGIRTE